MLKYKIKKTTRNQMEIQGPMSAKTKDFIQKICYRRTASVDMTRYGFISDSKMHPINLMMKPLQDKLKTICGTPRTPRSKSQSRRKSKVKKLQDPFANTTTVVSKRVSTGSKGSSVSKSKKLPKQIQAQS